MGNLSRIGDGQPVDEDFLNDIVDEVNNLSDIVWADQGALVWNGKTDAFNDVANYKIVGGQGSARFDGSGISTRANFTFGGIKFTKTPLVFIQAQATRNMISTVIRKDGDSCEVSFQISNGGRPPNSGYTVQYSWIAFGPTA